MDRFLQNYFTHIGVASLGVFVVYAYLHYELLYNNRDLLYWQDTLQKCLSEVGRYKYAYAFITCIALLNLILICTAISRKTNGTSWLEEEEREEELKERYRDFLFIRLLNAVDKTESKYLSMADRNGRVSVENYVRAHDEIWSAILEFRKDAHKLYKLNETEIWLPLEDVYCLLEDEENEVVKSTYYKAKVTIDYDTMATLLYE